MRQEKKNECCNYVGIKGKESALSFCIFFFLLEREVTEPVQKGEGYGRCIDRREEDEYQEEPVVCSSGWREAHLGCTGQGFCWQIERENHNRKVFIHPKGNCVCNGAPVN